MTTTDKLGMTLPPDGNTSWGDDIRNALRTLDAALISHYFAENSASHSGLNFAYLGGVYRNDATIVTVAGSAIALTDDTTNYIFVDVSAGAIAANTTGFISGDIPLFTVVAASGAISTVTDNRTLMSLGGGGGSGDYYTKAEIGAVADGTAGADLVGMTPITETGGAATVQAVIEALITRLKAVADSASGADLIGATAITSLGAAATVQAILEAMAPMTTQGDILYQGAAAPARLAAGTGKQVLRMNSGATAPEWVSNTRGISFSISGTLTTALSARFPSPCALTITKVLSSVKTAPTGAALIIDIHKVPKGSTTSTTVFTTQANRPTIADGEYEDESVAPDVTSIAQGDVIEIYIDQIGSTIAGADLAATAVCEVA